LERCPVGHQALSCVFAAAFFPLTLPSALLAECVFRHNFCAFTGAKGHSNPDKPVSSQDHRKKAGGCRQSLSGPQLSRRVHSRKPQPEGKNHCMGSFFPRVAPSCSTASVGSRRSCVWSRLGCHYLMSPTLSYLIESQIYIFRHPAGGWFGPGRSIQACF
jgi:hypothetical protein